MKPHEALLDCVHENCRVPSARIGEHLETLPSPTLANDMLTLISRTQNKDILNRRDCSRHFQKPKWTCGLPTIAAELRDGAARNVDTTNDKLKETQSGSHIPIQYLE
jgi:hypothetical protein